MNQTIYPIGIQNFEKIRKDGYLYIDKTALIYQLVKTGSYYFLSRPRRFGKSLLLSTLEAYFQGKKELFEGLAMEKLEKEWTKHPILHFDLNISHYDAPDSLYKILNDTLSRYEEEYGTRPTEETLPLRFAGIIDRAYRKTGQRAVILIDEYDKPLLQNLHDEETQNRFPEHAQTLLRCVEDHGQGHTLRPADRRDQVREGKRLQRPQQFGRYIHAGALRRHLRHHGNGAAYAFR